MQHPLQPDVLVEPDTPRNLVLVIQTQLRVEQLIPLPIDGVCILLVLRVGIDRSKLSVPDGRVAREVELGFAQELPLQTLQLLLRSRELLRAWKSEPTVVVERVHRVGQDGVLVEALPFRGEGVPVQKQDMVRVDLADRLFQAHVERRQADVLRVARLVDQVVAGNPSVGFVPCRDLLPQPDSAVLMVAMIPEGRVGGEVVRMPARRLTARQGMHIEDGVDLVFCTLDTKINNQTAAQRTGLQTYVMYQVNDSVQMLEAFLFQHARVHVVLKVTIVERQPQAVDTKALAELSIFFREEVLEKLVEEIVIFLLAQDGEHGRAMGRFVAGKASDEILHAGS